MANYITKIRTKDGDKQIDYNALANRPTKLSDLRNDLEIVLVDDVTGVEYKVGMSNSKLVLTEVQ